MCIFLKNHTSDNIWLVSYLSFEHPSCSLHSGVAQSCVWFVPTWTKRDFESRKHWAMFSNVHPVSSASGASFKYTEALQDLMQINVGYFCFGKAFLWGMMSNVNTYENVSASLNVRVLHSLVRNSDVYTTWCFLLIVKKKNLNGLFSR